MYYDSVGFCIQLGCLLISKNTKRFSKRYQIQLKMKHDWLANLNLCSLEHRKKFKVTRR